MAGMGPPPKQASARRRRNAAPGMTRLPAEGRKGRPPTWPLLDDITMVVAKRMADAQVEQLEEALAGCDGRSRKRLQRELDAERRKSAELEETMGARRRLEQDLWAQLWKTPQAVQWQRLSWDREVAQYVRWKVQAEMGSLDASKEARMLSDRLGLNPLAMLRLRWEVDEPAETQSEDPQPPRRKTKGKPDPRATLRVVG